MRQIHYRDVRGDLEAYLSEINNNRMPVSLLLDRITNKRNIGSMFRLADAARLAHIYGYQVPELEADRQVARVGRSTSRYVPFSNLREHAQLEALKDSHQLVALEWTTESVPYYRFEPTRQLLLVIGNEQHGVSDELLDLVDSSVHIPMMGVNTSMNVSVATGIAVYGLLEKMALLPKGS